MIGGASLGELGFVALLVVIVLLAPVAPRVGQAIGGLFEKRPAGHDERDPAGRDGGSPP